MKTYGLHIGAAIAVFWGINSWAATRFEEQFTLANQAYIDGDVAGALQLYEEIPHKGPAVYFNQGACYFRLGSFGQARAAWFAAEKLWPLLASRRELLSNLEIVESKLFASQKRSNMGRLARYGKSLLISLSPGMLALIALFLWLACCTYYGLFSRVSWGLVATVVLTGSCGTLLGLKCLLGRSSSGIALERQLEVRAGPAGTFPVRGLIAEGQEVRVGREHGEYMYVTAPTESGQPVEGWVAQKQIKKL